MVGGWVGAVGGLREREKERERVGEGRREERGVVTVLSRLVDLVRNI